MRQRTAVSIQDKILLSIDEAAGVLGLCRDSVYHLLLDLDPATGKARLHSVKVGRRRMVPRLALDRFIEHEMGKAL